MHDDIRNNESLAVFVEIGAVWRQAQAFRWFAIPIVFNVYVEFRELILKIEGQPRSDAAFAEVEFKQVPIILRNPPQRIVKPPVT